MNGGEENKGKRWENVEDDQMGVWCWFLVFSLIRLFEFKRWVMR